MKIILATITTLLLFSFAFGQTTATTADDKINAEIKQLFKDAETDFASMQGEVQNRGGGIITYQTAKNYFQSAGFTNWFRYYEADKTIGLQFSGSGTSAKQVFNLVKEKFKTIAKNTNSEKAKSPIEIKSSGNSDEVFVKGQKIALLQENSDKYLMWFYSNRSAWFEFNTLSQIKSMNALFSFFKAEIGQQDLFKESIDKTPKDNKKSATNDESLAKQCKDFYDKDEYPKAIEACTEAIKLNGDNADLYHRRGLSYYVTPDKPKTGLDALTSFGSANKNAAIADLTKCTELAPTKPDCFYALGFVQLQTLEKNRLDKAAQSFSEAIRLKSTDKNVYFLRAEAYREYYSRDEFFGKKDKQIRQRKELAVADYTKDIELRPTSYDSQLGRGLVYLDLEKYDLAVADFTKALDLLNASGEQNPDYRREILGNRARAYMNLGKNTEYCNDMKAIGKACEK